MEFRKTSNTHSGGRANHVVHPRSWIFHGMILTKDDRPVQLKRMKASDVRIRYHVLVGHAANPYDPAWEPYYEARLQKKLMAAVSAPEK